MRIEEMREMIWERRNEKRWGNEMMVDEEMRWWEEKRDEQNQRTRTLKMILAATPLTISPGYVFSMRDAATNGPF